MTTPQVAHRESPRWSGLGLSYGAVGAAGIWGPKYPPLKRGKADGRSELSRHSSNTRTERLVLASLQYGDACQLAHMLMSVTGVELHQPRLGPSRYLHELGLR